MNSQANKTTGFADRTKAKNLLNLIRCHKREMEAIKEDSKSNIEFITAMLQREIWGDGRDMMRKNPKLRPHISESLNQIQALFEKIDLFFYDTFEATKIRPLKALFEYMFFLDGEIRLSEEILENNPSEVRRLAIYLKGLLQDIEEKNYTDCKLQCKQEFDSIIASEYDLLSILSDIQKDEQLTYKFKDAVVDLKQKLERLIDLEYLGSIEQDPFMQLLQNRNIRTSDPSPVPEEVPEEIILPFTIEPAAKAKVVTLPKKYLFSRPFRIAVVFLGVFSVSMWVVAMLLSKYGHTFISNNQSIIGKTDSMVTTSVRAEKAINLPKEPLLSSNNLPVEETKIAYKKLNDEALIKETVKGTVASPKQSNSNPFTPKNERNISSIRESESKNKKDNKGLPQNYLTIITGPPECQIRIDSDPVGITNGKGEITIPGFRQVKPREYAIHITKANYETVHTTVKFNRYGERITRVFDLKKIK